MPKSSAVSRGEYPEERLKGLHQHAAQQRQATFDRLKTAVLALQARGAPITVHTIRAECGLDYKSYARNPEALALFHEHSTFLVAKRKAARAKRGKHPAEEQGHPKDPLLNYKKPQLVARLRQEMQQCGVLDLQYHQLLADRVRTDLQILQLEAELAKYREFLGHFRGQIHQAEHEDL